MILSFQEEIKNHKNFGNLRDYCYEIILKDNGRS